MQYTSKEIKKIVENHQHWLNKDCEGWKTMKADFRLMNLEGMNFESMDLRFADFSFANLDCACLYYANLRGACLFHSNLKSADLRHSDLRLTCLKYASLNSSLLYYAKLDGVALDNADLANAHFDEEEKLRCGQILKKPMTGYKKTNEGVIITAIIPAGATVFCINGSKCRTNKARIVDIGENANRVLHSYYDPTFEYRLNQDIKITNFDCMYNVECASGFHFFRTREEAEDYEW